MPTVAEVLKESGFSDEQITSLDQRAITAFTGILSAAQREREQAELAARASSDFYDNNIVPSLTAWDEERARIENERATAAAEAAFYRVQAQEAKNAGFIAQDAPSFKGQSRDPNSGRYVAGVPGTTPGSPTFDVNQVYQRAGDAVGIISDIQWEHERLFGQKLPISPTEMIRRADALKLDPRTYAAREFNWDARRQELQKKTQDEHDSKVRNDAIAERDKYWAERTGNNPDIRRPQDNVKITEIARAVRSGQRQDPLLMSETERRLQTRQAIREDMAPQQG
jgi:hypothetical protein